VTAPTDPREAHRPDDGCYDGSWEHALGVLRHRHANIAGTDPANGAPIRLCAADREAWPCQTVEALDLAASRLAARQDEPSPALRDALADLRAAVELCDARVHDTWGRGAMADFYTFRAADWNRVVAVARGHLSESALRQITHARTALAANPPQTREVYQSEFGMVDENDAIPRRPARPREPRPNSPTQRPRSSRGSKGST
jgi:hypothetical protein